jgi:hypothetical protein
MAQLSDKAIKIYDEYFKAGTTKSDFENKLKQSNHKVGFQELITYDSILKEIESYVGYDSIIGTSGVAYDVITKFKEYLGEQNLELNAYKYITTLDLTQELFDAFISTAAGSTGFGLVLNNSKLVYELAGNSAVVNLIIGNTVSLDALLNSNKAIKAFSETPLAASLIFNNIEANKKFKDYILFTNKATLPVNITEDGIDKFVYLNNKYIFFQDYTIYYSEDAVAWESAEIDIEPDIKTNTTWFDYDIVSDSYVIAFEASGDFIYTSSDLITWNPKLIPTSGPKTGVSFINGNLLLAIPGYIYKSTNLGDSWSQLKFDSGKNFYFNKFGDKIVWHTDLLSLGYINNNVISNNVGPVDSFDEQPIYVSSADSTLFFVTKTVDVDKTYNYIYYIKDLISIDNLQKYEFGKSAEDYNIQDIYYANGIYITKTSSGYTTSIDGINWSIKRLDSSYILNINGISNKGIFGGVVDTNLLSTNYNLLDEEDNGNGGGGGEPPVPSEPNQLEIECLFSLSYADIIKDNGFKLLLNDHYGYIDNKKYLLNIGTYIITDIPESDPVAILNNGKLGQIQYFGDPTKRFVNSVNGGSYFFYYGNIRISVLGDFGSVGIYSYTNGDVGGGNILEYNVAGAFDNLTDADTTTIDNTIVQTNTITC